MSSPRRWAPKAAQILTLDEVDQVVRDLRGKARRSRRTATNLIIFRLSTCCGLRASEIAGLTMRDVRLSKHKPYLALTGRITKGAVSREVPLWWDAGTLEDIRAWHEHRAGEGARAGDPFVCSTSRESDGRPLNKNQGRRRFIVSCTTLGKARRGSVTTHTGRHTFVSVALHGGRSLPQVRDAAGHSNISTTSLYAHVGQDQGVIGRLFAARPSSTTPAAPTEPPIVTTTKEARRCKPSRSSSRTTRGTRTH